MTQESWIVLRDRAESYFKSCIVLEKSADIDLIQNALESAHFSVELGMKAAIARHGGIYPDYGRRGHDLSDLLVVKFADQKSSIAFKAKTMRQTTPINIGLTAWSMDCRYKKMTQYNDMIGFIGDYKRLYIWIKDNLLT